MSELQTARLARYAWLSPDVAAVVEPLLALRPPLRESLAANEHLLDTTWYRLWPAKPAPSAAVTSALAARPLDTAQREWVIDHETRPGVIVAMLGHNRLSVEHQHRLAAAKGCKPAVAEALLSSEWCDPALARTLADKLSGWPWLEWAAKADVSDLSDAELEAFLASYSAWEPAKLTGRDYKRRSRLLKTLFANRPQLLRAAVFPDQHEAVITSAAGSRHLSDVDLQFVVAGYGYERTTPSSDDVAARQYALLALVNNPVCSAELLERFEADFSSSHAFKVTEVVRAVTARRNRNRPTVAVDYSDIDDPEVLKWLVGRARPYDDPETGKTRPGQPWDLPALAANVHLDNLAASDVHRALHHWAAREALTDSQRLVAFEALAAHYPELAVPSEFDTTRPGAESTEFGDPRHEERPEVSEQRLAAGARQLCNNVWGNEWMDYASAELGTSERAWETLIGLVDTFIGPFSDLVEAAKLL